MITTSTFPPARIYEHKIGDLVVSFNDVYWASWAAAYIVDERNEREVHAISTPISIVIDAHYAISSYMMFESASKKVYHASWDCVVPISTNYENYEKTTNWMRAMVESNYMKKEVMREIERFVTSGMAFG